MATNKIKDHLTSAGVSKDIVELYDNATNGSDKNAKKSKYYNFFTNTEWGRILAGSGVPIDSLPDDMLTDIANTYGITVDQIKNDYAEALTLSYEKKYGKENYINRMKVQNDVDVLMNAFNKYQPDTMNVDPTTGLSNQYQTYLDALNAASNQQYNIAMQELDVAENQMLRSIGLSQRQMERDIAKRRQQALKSGMSTAQLAAQEQQNILAAQTGATQIAQQYADQRYGTINQFAGSAAQNYANVLGQQTESLVNAQNNSYNNLMSAWAQMYAADKYQQ